ncbi:hypothetical protein HanPSC8_Chr00c329g0807761 [Helianthus annuus]|nr:hypothetical protein HanPSC8_Chr00c329g0807761 [Helianthus annuus]
MHHRLHPSTPLIEESGRLRICYPKRIPSSPNRCHPWRRRYPPHISSMMHPWLLGTTM